MQIRTREQLISELNCYIDNGYLDINSFDNPPDEAAIALNELYIIDSDECENFCKRIMLSRDIGDSYLDSLCLLHLFDLNKEFALRYVEENIDNMPAPILGAAMDGLSQYSNTTFRQNFSNDLITKILHKYNDVTKDPFFENMLESSYTFFTKSFL
ncbi:hypothetical protein [Providencia rettgeri]|uniref:hypothetical protein n=1 Tax=Providencia rettgeri TaxID=587 RepID=UPI0018C689B6|nr:hypothetical protein [Providencia rettgeri]MBG5925828.1 hypothetical protein [Providencia rettgeri]